VVKEREHRRTDRHTGVPYGSHAGTSLQTYYRWRKKYGGLMPSEMKRLEEENSRLKKLVADLSLERAMLQDVIKRKV
jgi:putative transposase